MIKDIIEIFENTDLTMNYGSISKVDQHKYTSLIKELLKLEYPQLTFKPTVIDTTVRNDGGFLSINDQYKEKVINCKKLEFKRYYPSIIVKLAEANLIENTNETLMFCYMVKNFDQIINISNETTFRTFINYYFGYKRGFNGLVTNYSSDILNNIIKICGGYYIEDRKCNFDVEISTDMLLDFERNGTLMLEDMGYKVDRLFSLPDLTSK